MTPSLEFNYGRTYCWLKNRKSQGFSTGRATEMLMKWPDRKLRLTVATSPQTVAHWGRKESCQKISIDEPEFDSDFYIASNQPEIAKRMLNNGVQWQIEQLRRHMANREVVITIDRGKLLISKPGYIKAQQDLEDFVQFCLNLFDQLMLVDAQGIEFMNENQAAVVSDVKCPICSEEIIQDMVVCRRCKTPHCRDCWQYNGQCATFACSEKRFISTSEIRVCDL